MIADPTIRFEFTLAKELGMTRAELQGRMSGSEFAGWIAYYNLEARDRERAEKRSRARSRARNMSLAANMGTAG